MFLDTDQPRRGSNRLIFFCYRLRIRIYNDFGEVCCRERSGILLRGADGKNIDRPAANQTAPFAIGFRAANKKYT